MSTFDKILWVFVLTIAFLVLAFASTAMGLSMFASGKIDFCYIEQHNPGLGQPQYFLYGFRDWRSDDRIGVFASLEEAAQGAETVHCPLSSVEGNESGVSK